MQVTDAVIGVYICYIANPQLIRPCGHETFDEILPFVVAVIGIRCMARFGRTAEQHVLAEYFQKSIASGHPILTEHIAKHEPQFVSANSRIYATDFFYCANNTGFSAEFLITITLKLVIGLSTVAKQFASDFDVQTFTLAKASYCLAPDFFLI